MLNKTTAAPENRRPWRWYRVGAPEEHLSGSVLLRSSTRVGAPEEPGSVLLRGWLLRSRVAVLRSGHLPPTSRVARLWSLACPWWGSGGKEYWPVSKPPSRSLTLLTFWAAGKVSLAPFSQVTCAESAAASQAFNFRGGGARRSQRHTYPLILALEGNILDDCSITFP